MKSTIEQINEKLNIAIEILELLLHGNNRISYKARCKIRDKIEFLKSQQEVHVNTPFFGDISNIPTVTTTGESQQEQEEQSKSAEEILKAEMSQFYWELIESQKTLDGEMTFKKWIIEAMQVYRNEGRREELIRFADWYYCEQGEIDEFTIEYIDEYLNPIK